MNPDDFLLARRLGRRLGLEAGVRAATTATDRQAPPGEVHDDRAHGLGCPSHEVHPAFESQVVRLGEPDERFVDERAGIEQRVPASGAQPPAREPAQIGVDRRIQRIGGFAVPILGAMDQLREMERHVRTLLKKTDRTPESGTGS
jgi:hypothetical protein